MIEKNGFYCIDEKFFTEMDDPYLKSNKSERRPHFYCFKDENGLYWMIPLSSRVAKYRRIMAERAKASKPCDIIHIVKLDNGRESVFLIQDIFPITEKYISREYTINGTPLKLTSKSSALEIERKAKTVLAILKNGVRLMYTQPNISAILDKLSKQTA